MSEDSCALGYTAQHPYYYGHEIFNLLAKKQLTSKLITPFHYKQTTNKTFYLYIAIVLCYLHFLVFVIWSKCYTNLSQGFSLPREPELRGLSEIVIECFSLIMLYLEEVKA